MYHVCEEIADVVNQEKYGLLPCKEILLAARCPPSLQAIQPEGALRPNARLHSPRRTKSWEILNRDAETWE